MPFSIKHVAIHFVYERATTMHKILHILSTAIHFLGGLCTMLIMQTLMLPFALKGKKRQELMTLHDALKIRKPVK